MQTKKPAFHLSYVEAERTLRARDKDTFLCLAARGSLRVELYRPRKIDRQQPHSQDECYVITEGAGMFEMADETVPFQPGDLLFVAAGVPHRFTAFGDSMTCWVVFFGPDGGDASAPSAS